MVEANARAKPAKEALIAGEATATKAIAPTIQPDIILKRTDSQRFTSEDIVSLYCN